MRVLFVEDSETLCQTVGATLRRSGWAVDVSRDGEDGLWHATNHDYDVIILDLMLPRLDGLSVLRKLRAQGRNTPVLLLTAKTSVPDRVIGLNHGADDYLGKPFALEELLARLAALARRRYDCGRPVLELGAMRIDTGRREVAWRGQTIPLLPREYALLEYLALRRDTVVTRSEIEAHIYDSLAEPMSNVVDSAICILRRKLAEAGLPALIQTRRGQGYCLECDPSAAN
jgi:DNA-binding response OmpR family regulator